MMTQTESLAESQAALKALSEITAALSLGGVKRREKPEGVTVSDYLKKLYAMKSSILDDDMEHFKAILTDMESPKTIYAKANEVQRSQVQLIVADLLHDSISMQNRDTYIFGLAKVFDMNERNKLGFIPLHLAVGRGKFKIVSMLVRAGSNVNLQNDLGRSPLHIAAHKGFTEVANFLLAHGADIDARDRDLWTALHWACRNHHLDMLRLLLRSGARLDVRTNKGLSPLDMSLTMSPTLPPQWHPMTAWHLVVYGAGRVSPCAFRRWLTEVLREQPLAPEIMPVVSQLLLLFTKAAAIDSPLLEEARDFLAPEELNEARRLISEPCALTQLCRTEIRALLRAGAGHRTFVENAGKLALPTAVRQFVLLKS